MKRTRLIALIVIVGTVIVPFLHAAVPSAERIALMALYDATGGPQWLDAEGWYGPPGTECDWYGVTCDPGGETVTRISLAQNHLNGSLPSEIGSLDGLVELDLSWNLLRGTIPDSISNLVSLRSLKLEDNDLMLPLPVSLFTMVQLENLDVSGNRLDGMLPAGLSAMSGLTSLRLSHNAFRGEIPAELTDLVGLVPGELDLRFNALTTGDPSVRAFLDQKHGGAGWLGTQTVPPTNISSNIDGLAWTPVEYTADRGTYRIIIDYQSGGNALILAAASKSSSSLRIGVGDIVGELVATLHTVTEPHGRQKNLLISAPSESHEFSLFGYAPFFPFFAVGVKPEPLVQIGGVPQNSTFFTVLNYGGAPGAALLEPQGDFFSISETAFNLDAFETRRIDVSSVTRPAGEYSGEVLFSGDGLFEDLSIPISLLSLPAPPDPEGRPDRSRLDLTTGRTVFRSTAVFRNDGADDLTGVVESDVDWLIPVTETIAIAAGESAEIEYEIDPERRPDGFSEEGISFGGALRLVYVDDVAEGAKRRSVSSEHTTGISTTLATVVNTIPPEVASGDVPAFENGERGFLVPGLMDGEGRFSDVSIANSFGAQRVEDLRAFFARSGNAGESLQADFPQLRRRAAFFLAAPVRTVFDSGGTTGSMQLRTLDSDALLVSARLVVEGDGGALFGTALPVFDSSRLAAPGEEQILTGLGARADLFVQNAGPGTASVSIELLDRDGQAVSRLGPFGIESWKTLAIDDFVSGTELTAIVLNEPGSESPVSAHAVVSDETSTDPWTVLDWARYWGERRTTPMLLPVARRTGPPGSPSVRRRSVLRPGAASVEQAGVNLTMFNPLETPSAVKLTFHPLRGDVVEEVVLLNPRETRTAEDLLGSIFGQTGSSNGYVRILPLRGEIVATARTVRTGSTGDLVGSAVPLHPRGAGMRLGERRSIAALEDSRSATVTEGIPGTWRSSVSLLETSGKSVRVSATMRVPTGQSLAAATVRREFELGPNELRPLGTVARAIMGEEREAAISDLHDLQLDLVVIEGDGSVVVVTEMTENATGDPLIRFD